MVDQSGNVNNNQVADNYIEEMKEDIAKAQALIAELKKLAPQAKDYQHLLALYEIWNRIFPGKYTAKVKQMQALVDQINAQIKSVEGQLTALDPSFASLDAAIQSLEDGGLDPEADAHMIQDVLNHLCDAALDKFECDEWEKKMQQDQGNNKDLLEDAMHAIGAASQESGTLNNLMDEMSQLIVALNQQKDSAEADLKRYHWYNSWCHQGSISHDHNTIAHANLVIQALTAIMTDIAPLIADAASEVYAMASLSMEKIIDRLIKIIEDPKLTTHAKADEIKVLMALALGILAMIQSDAAQEKANDRQTENKAATYGVQMNIDDQKAQLKELKEELSYAHTMGTLMQIAKPLLEIAGCLLAPGLGSFLVMLAFAVADQAGLTNKLTHVIAEQTGSTAAMCITGALEIAAVLAGGAGIEEIAQSATQEVTEQTVKETAAISAQIVNTVVKQSVAAAEDAGVKVTAETVDAVRKVVSEAVEGAVKEAAAKSVQTFNNQAAATLIPQIIKAGGIKVAVEEAALTSAKQAAEAAGQDIQFLAEATARGAQVSSEETLVVAKRAATGAVANVFGTTAKNVQSLSENAERSLASKSLTRAATVATYTALNDGLLSYGVEEALLASGQKKDDQTFENVMMAMKVIEQILASLVLMYGTGIMDTILPKNTTTAFLKVGAVGQMVGIGADAVSEGGQADALMQKADLIKIMNNTKVSSDMLEMLLQQFQAQAQIDLKHARDQFSEQASNFTLIMNLENNAQTLARVIAEQAV